MGRMKHRVLVLKDTTAKQAAWLQIDDLDMDKLYEIVGEFMLQTLQRFYIRAYERKTVPSIKLVSLAMTEEGFDSLKQSTWRSELEELIRDVERGTKN